MTRDEVIQGQFAVPGSIRGFFGDYRFLSNFYPAQIELGVAWPDSETLFQACKLAPDDPQRWQEADRIRTCGSPREAKRLGRLVRCRADWSVVRILAMASVVYLKFIQHPELAAKLLETGDLVLEEANWWGDDFWGTVDGIGQNQLGKVLMTTRDVLRRQR